MGVIHFLTRKLILIAAGSFLIGLIIITAFAQKGKKTEPAGGDFHRLWYDGNAEVSSYILTQNRYGELKQFHPAERQHKF